MYKKKDIMDVLIPHFNKYPLLTKKRSDFLLFKQIVELMINKSHLSCAGLLQIVGIKAYLNKGLSNELKQLFLISYLCRRPSVELKGISDTNWLAGFTSGDVVFLFIL
ncbi:hypothetical protein HOY82DRAFT_495549 [Tuber indicum]|nr:hypothetical protein HOY82DRAFT_495549 [Tuber indicum]